MHRLSTDRLTLRPLQKKDWPQIQFLRSDEEVNTYVDRPPAATKEAALAFISKISVGTEENLHYYWAICKKEEDILIGSICLWNFSKSKTIAEVGFDLHPDSQGKGIMTEALQSVINFAFNVLHVNSIEAFTHCHNQASINLLKNHSFKLLIDRKDHEFKENIIFNLSNPLSSLQDLSDQNNTS